MYLNSILGQHRACDPSFHCVTGLGARGAMPLCQYLGVGPSEGKCFAAVRREKSSMKALQTRALLPNPEYPECIAPVFECKWMPKYGIRKWLKMRCGNLMEGSKMAVIDAELASTIASTNPPCDKPSASFSATSSQTPHKQEAKCVRALTVKRLDLVPEDVVSNKAWWRRADVVMDTREVMIKSVGSMCRAMGQTEASVASVLPDEKWREREMRKQIEEFDWFARAPENSANLEVLIHYCFEYLRSRRLVYGLPAYVWSGQALIPLTRSKDPEPHASCPREADAMPVNLIALEHMGGTMMESWLKDVYLSADRVLSDIAQVAVCLAGLQLHLGYFHHSLSPCHFREVGLHDSCHCPSIRECGCTLNVLWGGKRFRIPLHGRRWVLASPMPGSFVFKGERYISLEMQPALIDISLPFHSDLASFARTAIPALEPLILHTDPQRCELFALLRSWTEAVCGPYVRNLMDLEDRVCRGRRTPECNLSFFRSAHSEFDGQPFSLDNAIPVMQRSQPAFQRFLDEGSDEKGPATANGQNHYDLDAPLEPGSWIDKAIKEAQFNNRRRAARKKGLEDSVSKAAEMEDLLRAVGRKQKELARQKGEEDEERTKAMNEKLADLENLIRSAELPNSKMEQFQVLIRDLRKLPEETQRRGEHLRQVERAAAEIETGPSVSLHDLNLQVRVNNVRVEQVNK